MSETNKNLKSTVTIGRLISICNRFYPDDQLDKEWKFINGQAGEFPGDGLASFIVAELSDTYDPAALTEVTPISDALNALAVAQTELSNVIKGLMGYMTDSVLLEFLTMCQNSRFPATVSTLVGWLDSYPEELVNQSRGNIQKRFLQLTGGPVGFITQQAFINALETLNKSVNVELVKETVVKPAS